MTGPLATAAIAAPLILGAWFLVLALTNRPPARLTWVALALVEAVLIAFGVWGVVEMVQRATDFAKLEYLLYLVGLAAVLPVAGWWVRGEKSRAAAVVLLVACLVVPIMVVRVQQVWAGA